MRRPSFALLSVLAAINLIQLTQATFAGPPTPSPRASLVPVHSLRLEAVIKDGKKYWLPEKLRAKKGEKIHLRLENHIPGPNSIHGFRLPAFHIEELVDNQGKSIEFTADQAGTFKFDCQLHPGHVGGELIVQE